MRLNDEEKINPQIVVILICKLPFWWVDEAQDQHKNIKLHRPNVQCFFSTEQDHVQQQGKRRKSNDALRRCRRIEAANAPSNADDK